MTMNLWTKLGLSIRIVHMAVMHGIYICNGTELNKRHICVCTVKGCVLGLHIVNLFLCDAPILAS